MGDIILFRTLKCLLLGTLPSFVAANIKRPGHRCLRTDAGRQLYVEARVVPYEKPGTYRFLVRHDYDRICRRWL